MEPQSSAPQNPFSFSFEPRTARAIGTAVCILAGCGFPVAATIAVLVLVRTRPLHGLTWLLAPGIPILIVGQLWSIWILIGRLPPRANRAWNPFRSRLKTRDLFGGLPRLARGAVIAVFLLTWVSGATSFLYLQQGGPDPPTLHCKYPLDNHGVRTCTDERTYYRAARAEQRLAASAFAAFFVFHLGIAAGELIRRRRED